MSLNDEAYTVQTPVHTLRFKSLEMAMSYYRMLISYGLAPKDLIVREPNGELVDIVPSDHA